MSLTPNYGNDADTPRSGQLTPNTIANQLSQLDLPSPANLHLGDGQRASTGAKSANDGRDLSAQLSKMSFPEPEALSKASSHRRSESQSQDLAEQLSRMNLPQPERIFGPDETKPDNRKQGVSAEDWDKVKLDDEVPEAVKSPTQMHFRRDSRTQSISSAPPAVPTPSVAPIPAAQAAGTAKEQKITPFDVQGGVDAEGREIGM